MPSLRSIILDGRFGSLPDLPPEDDQIELQHIGIAKRQLNRRDTILVNATEVARDVLSTSTEVRWEDASKIPCPKPPFRRMWLEMNLGLIGSGGRRFGCLTQRIDVPPGRDPVEAYARGNIIHPVEFPIREGLKIPSELSRLMKDNPGEMIEAFSEVMSGSEWKDHPLDLAEFRKDPPYERITRDNPSTIVSFTVWEEVPHCAGAAISGTVFYWLDQDGAVEGSWWSSWPERETWPEGDKTEAVRSKLGWALAWVMHTFARLNCHNVKLLPMKAGAPSPKQIKKHKEPLTVWHEIVVEKVIERYAGPAIKSGEKADLRFHKVRGHYADYTKGAGLFGRYKVRIWVEEHSRGNIEAGEVVADYTVQ